MFKRKPIPNTPYVEMSLIDLLKQYIISKLPQRKSKVSQNKIYPEPRMPDEEITYIAIVLDGVVEDVMRAQNRLAALLLSNPEFVEFDPKSQNPQIGFSKYKDGNFWEENLEAKEDEKN